MATEKQKNFGKEDFLDVVCPKVSEVLGVKLSRDKVWKILHIFFDAAVQMPTPERTLSLAGVGVFWISLTGRAVKKWRFKIRPSSRFTDHLNASTKAGGEPLEKHSEEFLGIKDVGSFKDI